MSKRELFDNHPKTAKKRLNKLPENPEKKQINQAVALGRFPSWLHRKLPKGNTLIQTSKATNGKRLHTVCEEAKCPNLLECWSKKTATFLLMGKECTRACGFCDINFNKNPTSLDPQEPEKVLEAVKTLGLKHVVMTMVARDDLDDGGATHLVACIKKIHKNCPSTTVEVLTSDFSGNTNAYDQVLAAHPEIFNYNIETVRELTPRVRHKATYERTLKLLQYAKYNRQTSNMYVKSGIMVGLGETDEQVKTTIQDLKNHGCDIITIGQYLQASQHKLLVKAFITPEQFKTYEDFGHSIGVQHMYCGPFVRSSYNADKVIASIHQKHLLKNDRKLAYDPKAIHHVR